MGPNGQPFDVFENKNFRANLGNQANEIVNESIARVF